jgi:hypothetical protein
MRKASWLFTPFAVVASLPCLATAVTSPCATETPLPSCGTETAADLNSIAQWAALSLYGTWDTAPYDGPVPEATGYGFTCCTATVSDPDELFLVPDVVNSTEGMWDGNFTAIAEMADGDTLTVTGTPIPIDPVPEPDLGWLVAALAGSILVWEFRRPSSRTSSASTVGSLSSAISHQIRAGQSPLQGP